MDFGNFTDMKPRSQDFSWVDIYVVVGDLWNRDKDANHPGVHESAQFS